MIPSRRMTVNSGMNIRFSGNAVYQDCGWLTNVRQHHWRVWRSERGHNVEPLITAGDVKHLISLYSEKQFWRQCWQRVQILQTSGSCAACCTVMHSSVKRLQYCCFHFSLRSSFMELCSSCVELFCDSRRPLSSHFSLMSWVPQCPISYLVMMLLPSFLYLFLTKFTFPAPVSLNIEKT